MRFPPFLSLLANQIRVRSQALDRVVNRAIGDLSADIICSENRTVFRERSSRKTVSFEEQMSQEKYPSIFLKSNGGYCLFKTRYFPIYVEKALTHCLR